MVEDLITPRLVVALDHLDDILKVEFFAQRLDKVSPDLIYKVNPSVIYGQGIAALGTFDARRKVMADMVLAASPGENRKTLDYLMKANIRFVTVSPTVGRKALTDLAEDTVYSGTELIARTIPTDFTDQDCQQTYGQETINSAVKHFAEIVQEAGCDGLMVPGSALEVAQYFPSMKIFVSGIRPAWHPEVGPNDHRQILSPADAIRRGATHLIIGEPVYKSVSPEQAVRYILDEMNRAKIRAH